MVAAKKHIPIVKKRMYSTLVTDALSEPNPHREIDTALPEDTTGFLKKTEMLTESLE